MTWSNVKKIQLAELLEKLAQLHSRIVELNIKQQYLRAKQQGLMLQLRFPDQKVANQPEPHQDRSLEKPK